MMQATTISAMLMATILSKLNPHKSLGLHLHLLRFLVPVISQPLTLLFKLFILTKIIWDDWRRAVATAIHKQGATTDTINNHQTNVLELSGRWKSVQSRAEVMRVTRVDRVREVSLSYPAWRAFKLSIDWVITTTACRRLQLFISLTKNDCWWVNVSTRGLARVSGCPRRFRGMHNAKNSSGSTETNPFMILKVSMRSPLSLLCSIKIHLNPRRRLNSGTNCRVCSNAYHCFHLRIHLLNPLHKLLVSFLLFLICLLTIS